MRLKYYLKKYRYNPKRSFLFLFLFLFLVSFTIGYAFLTQTLSIEGSSTLVGATWDIHFDNLVVTTGSVTATTEATITTPTSVTFSAQLENPGDFYEFNVDVVNEGTMNAMIDSIQVLPILTAEQQEYLEYQITYSDGSPILVYQRLNAGTQESLKVRFGYKAGLDSSLYPIEDQELTINFEVVYVQENDDAIDVEHVFSLYNTLASASVMDNINSTNVNNSPAGIDFSQNSSDTNGKGIYTRSGTENDTYPVHYFRGNVTNNNVLFAGICWKIVRTTDTGGIKLIYNGIADSGSCDISNREGIGRSKWNDDLTQLYQIGYMNGVPYNMLVSGRGQWSYYSLAPDVIYENNQYTLVSNDDYSIINNYAINENFAYRHYTCGTTSTTCEKVWYIYYVNGSIPRYYELSNGDKIEDAVDDMLSNVSDSKMKTFIDSWYAGNMNTFTNYLEDTVWCNEIGLDLTAELVITNINTVMSGLNPVGGYDYFSPSTGYERINDFHIPNLSCVRLDDSYTVSSANGNGDLTYPVGLITRDEVMLAGNISSNSYLYFTYNYWIIQPFYYDGSHKTFSYYNDYNEDFVRPSISLKHNSVCSDGDGTATNPYVVVTH